MSMTVDYVQVRGKASKSYRYRRKVPPALKATLDKGEIVIPLGKSKAEALRNYNEAHRKAELVLRAAWEEVNGVKKPVGTLTAREQFRQTIEDVKALGFNPYHGEGDGGEDDLSWVARSVIVDQIAAKYERDPDTDDPIDVTAKDTELVRILNSSQLPKAPEPTIEDAKRLYLKDRFAESEPKPLERKRDEQRAARAVGMVSKALGASSENITVASITREQARTVQAYIRDEVPRKATVDRYLNDIRAIINHAIAEVTELHGRINHFTGLPALAGGRNGGIKPEDEGRPLTGDELRQIRQRIATHADQPDLLLIWRLLEGTGCRLAEVTGLRVVDVVVEGGMPYIDLAWHEGRRLKTVASRRRVPLIGDALEAAKRALELAGKGQELFPRYGVEGGNTNASAALMKHVRAVTKDRLARVHSLRHGMKDKLKLAGVETDVQNLVLGHALEGEGKRYGGPDGRLVEATRALRKALA